jgi:WD40 repeat protein
MSLVIVVLIGLVIGLLSARLEQAEAGKREAIGRAEELGKEVERRAREIKLVEAHLALEHAMNHFRQDEAANGLLWLARGLEAVPEDEAALQRSFRVLLAGWSRQIHPVKQVFPIGRAQFVRSPDGRILVTTASKVPKSEFFKGSEAEIRLWDAATGKPLGQPIPPPTDYFNRVAFSPDGKFLVMAYRDQPGNRLLVIRFWDVATRQPVGKPMLQSQKADEIRYLNVIAFSPDGKRLVTHYSQSHPESREEIRLWEVPTGKAVGEPLPAKYVHVAVFSPNGKTLLTGGGKWDEPPYEVRLWEAATGKPGGEPIKHDYVVFAAAFSPDGKLFVTGGMKRNPHLRDQSPGFAQAWETATGKPVGGEIVHSRAVVGVHFSPNGKKIVTRTADYYFRLFTYEPLGWSRVGELIPAHSAARYSGEVTFSSDSKTVLLVRDSAGVSGTVRLWDTATGEAIGGPLAGSNGYGVAFDPAGKKVQASASGGEVRRWEITLPSAGRKLQMPEKAVLGPQAFSPDGKTVAMAVSRDKKHQEVWFWDRKTAEQSGDPLRLEGKARELAYSPDGKTLLTVTEQVRLWDVATRKPIGGPIGKPIPFFHSWGRQAFSPDSKTVLAADGKIVRLWDTRTGKAVGKPFAHQKQVNAVAFSPDGKRILTSSEDRSAVRLWDAKTAEPVAEPLGLSATVSSVGFSRGGKALLTFDRWEVRLWDTATGRPIGEPIKSVFTLAPLLSPDGKTLLTPGYNDKHARLWDVATGKPRGRYLQHESIGVVTLSPDGKTIVTAGYGGMQLWDTATGQPIGRMLWRTRVSPNKPMVTVKAVDFSPDGQTLLAQGGMPSWDPPSDEARLFEVPRPVEGDAERLRLWGEVITARELDAGGEVVELDAKTWQERWQRLQKLGGPPGP